jgi:iron complex outermembrane receptor protein
MKPYSLLLLLLAFAVTASAQNSLSGRITDSNTRSGIPGAVIYLPELKRGASTDTSGRYKLNNIPAGKFIVQVQSLSYSSQSKSIEIKGDVVMDTELSDAHTELDEVLVTGISSATQKQNNPVAITTINSNELNQESSTNIIDAVANVPGVSQITTGAAVSKPVIRGLGFNRVIVLHDNIRQEGQQWGDEHGIEIDEFSIGKAEILKGPASLMYGSDGMAGAINLLSPDPVEEGHIGGSIVSNYQTNNGLIGNSAMIGGNIKGWSWQARGSHKIAGNYSNRYDEKVYNSGFEERNFSGNAGMNRKWGYSHLSFSSFSQEIGMIEGERDSLGRFIKMIAVNDSTEEVPVSTKDLEGYDIDFPKQKIAHRKIGSGNMFFFTHSKLAVDIAFQQNERQELEDVLAPSDPALHFLLNTTNYNVKYFFPEKNGWHFTTGLNGMLQNSSNKGEEYLVPDYNIFDAGVFVFAGRSIEKWNFSAGIRFDNRSISTEALYIDSLEHVVQPGAQDAFVKFNAIDNSYSNISGAAGFTLQSTEKLLLRFNVARGFRSPNVAELSANGIHEGTYRYEIGNPALKSETSLQLDAGLDYSTDHIECTVSGFANFISNYIYIQKVTSASGTDSIIDPTEPAPVHAFTQGDAKLYGGEVSIDIHPHPLDWLHFENSIAVVYGINTSKTGDKDLPYMPAPRYQGELRADIKDAGKFFSRTYIKLEADHFFKQSRIYSENNTETITPAYTLLNAGIGSDVLNTKKRTVASIHFIAGNLLDAAYQSHLSRLKYAPVNPANGRQGIFAMGRNFSIKLIIPFRIK